MVRNGEIERVARGVYIDPSYENYDELYIFQIQNKVCIFLSDCTLFTRSDRKTTFY